jgi:hypothetical protein
MLRIRITLTTKRKLILRQKVILTMSDDTSSEVGDEYESDPWAPLKAEAAQQS